MKRTLRDPSFCCCIKINISKNFRGMPNVKIFILGRLEHFEIILIYKNYLKTTKGNI